jgi:uncharacterized linocin/CFP29 family protein
MEAGGLDAFTPQALRVNATLRRDEWIAFDTRVVQAYTTRIRIVGDLIAAGLTQPIPNSFGRTVFEYERMGEISPASVSMDGMVNTENDRPEFDAAQLPLPITHKDFWINARTLAASRNRGPALDTIMVGLAGRVIAEAQEDMVVLGGKTFGGLTIHGLTTHPDRLTDTFTHWATGGKTGPQALTDVFNMIQALKDNRFYGGPYWLYLPSDSELFLSGDYTANYARTVRERLLQVDQLTRIEVLDNLPSGNAVMLQATPEVIQLLQGEQLQTIQWDINGGMQVNFKAMMIQVPLIRADQNNRVGIVHFAT